MLTQSYNPFTQKQLETLRELAHLIKKTDMVLIGAKALACYYTLQWRETNDLDLVVLLKKESQTELFKNANWQQGNSEHRWISPQDIIVDIIPIGTLPVTNDHITFNNREAVLSVAGFELAFTNFHEFVFGDVHLNVVTPYCLALLKMASFLDRPTERERDLTDIGHIMEQYIEHDEDRRYNDDENIPIDISYEAVGAYLLGKDMRAICKDKHVEIINAWFRLVNPDSHWYGIMNRVGPSSWKHRKDALIELLEALKRCFSTKV